ncbi:protein-tyrosine-phosphatase [Dimargaris xerosporica]|nr:protein-tyrosine-phosphatase [Dimargaris xerosporica]
MAQLPLLVPPFRFASVEPNVYRGGYPDQPNQRFLQRLCLATVVSLVPEPPSVWLRTYCETNGIALRWFQVASPKDSVTLDNATVRRCIEILIDPTNHPVFIHCGDGMGNTGLVVICLRKLQLWPLSSAVAECLRFTQTGAFTSDEEEFVDAFCHDIAIPPIIPRWLWGPPVSPPLQLPCKLVEWLAAETTLSATSTEAATQVRQAMAQLHQQHLCTVCQALPFANHPTMHLLLQTPAWEQE